MLPLPVLVRGSTLLAVATLLVACLRERVRLGDGPLDADGGDLPTQDAAVGPTSTESVSASSSDGYASSSIAQPLPSEVSSALSPSNSSSTSIAPDAGSGCVRGQVTGEEVLWIGDSWLRIPGNQETGVEIRARETGALGADETYTNRAQGAQYLADIVAQYEAELRVGTPPKVLIMNGGTWDTIQRGASEENVRKVVTEFEDFLARLANDGSVEHVVYMLCPELTNIIGAAELRPGLVDACSASSVPCHFLDLQPFWASDPDYYSDASGYQASVAGAELIAEQIWSIMQDECIAQ